MKFRAKFGHYVQMCLAAIEIPERIPPIGYEFPEEEPEVKMNVELEPYANGVRLCGVQTVSLEWDEAA